MGGLTFEQWQLLATRKKGERRAKIPKEWRIPRSLVKKWEEAESVIEFPATSGFFTKRELNITGATASEVVKNVAAGKWSAVEVTRAVCKRAAVAQQLVNCLTEICFEDALIRARELDEHFAAGKPLGPLHGLPISLKDQFNIPGLDTTLGYTSRVPSLPAYPSHLVASLLSSGAIIYAKTNIPTTILSGETSNQIFGTTLHPLNRSWTPGGSSGGESALVAFGGSHLGVGTDIGGSIRHPCLLTGLYGLRPSHGRIPMRGAEATMRGQEAVRSVAGPMCRSAADIRLFMASVLASKPWIRDTQCLPIPWRIEEEHLPSVLCFGFATGDGDAAPTPPHRRAMDLVRKKLTAAGHVCIDFTPVEMPAARDVIDAFFNADGGAEFRADLSASNEPFPAWLSSPTKRPALTVSETWEAQAERDRVAEDWLDRWNATEIVSSTGRPMDALISPGFHFPAIRHGCAKASNYAAIGAVLDLSTGVFPVTKVCPERDRVDHHHDDWTPMFDGDVEVMENYIGPEEYKDAPVGLQIMGRRLEEEKVTAMMGLISDVVGVDY
ncbi:fatty-acid amide hydrolase like protein [Zymoseptoria brevis]|uniref:amidase n=1 Tax=Zymoseptoria brevis TaxID=1047168 RepID=A0A0F4G8U3_9PEZI|nr:fatty-acid amide hydrolase like protein [Zymoseptoria brevis]